MNANKNLLFFSLEDWNDIWRRNQFICAGLAKRHPDASILWISPPADLILCLGGVAPRSDLLAAVTTSAVVAAQFKQITIIKPFKPLPNLIGQQVNTLIQRAQVRHHLKQLGWKSFTAWVNNQAVRPIVEMLSPEQLILDITDDWTQASMTARARRAVIADESYLLKRADHVIVCSPGLLASRKQQCQRISLIPNGVDAQRYSPESLGRLPSPTDMTAIKKPVAGYTGTLHEDRLDVELLAAVASQLPDINFVLVGPDCLHTARRRRLAALGNCYILGPRPYDELPAYMAHFDVLIAPHKVTPFTESLDPLKLYEYMSTGKPVVATPCAGFRELVSFITIAESPAAFARGVRGALSQPDEATAQRRIEWAGRHTWEQRLEAIEAILTWDRRKV